MAKRKKPPARKTSVERRSVIGYRRVLKDMTALLEQSRRGSARAVNVVMTATYWEMGRRIIDQEQAGRQRAHYGEELLDRLSMDLTERFGRGFSRQNLQYMRQFYLCYPQLRIRQTASGNSSGSIRQTASGNSGNAGGLAGLEAVSEAFPLPWSHYVRLVGVDDENARAFYETEALRGGWSVRQLDRQVATRFYERIGSSRAKKLMLAKAGKRSKHEVLTPEEELRDPLVLDFLGLKDQYSESDLEESLIGRLEEFLLELGGDFAFVGKQRRLRVGKAWYRVDLLFFHRALRCLVIIDLKVGRFTHADAGQMHMYLNYAREHWTNEGENPPVGLVLCTEKDDAVAHYALEGLPNKVMAREYKLKLPDAKKLEKEVERARRELERRRR